MSTRGESTSKLASAAIENVISSLKIRCSWPTMKALLATKLLKPGAGYPDLIGRANKGDAESSTISLLARKTYFDVMAAGSRFIQLYEVDKLLGLALVAKLDRAVVPTSDFLKSYPLPLDLVDLASAPIESTLCEIRKIAVDSYQLILCSKRVVEERLVIDSTSTPQVMTAISAAVASANPIGGAATPMGGYDRFVGYKVIPVQVFDVITLRPNLNRLEVSLDLAHRGLGIDGAIAAQKLLLAVSAMIPEMQSISEGQPDNLFDAIAGIYSAKKTTDVNVIDIGIRTPSGAVTRGRMPTLDEDIRYEDYHKAGAEAVANKATAVAQVVPVGSAQSEPAFPEAAPQVEAALASQIGSKTRVNPHGVVAAWTFAVPKGKATVKLWTTLAQAASSAPILYGMEVSDALADSDVLQAVNKVVKYL